MGCGWVWEFYVELLKVLVKFLQVLASLAIGIVLGAPPGVFCAIIIIAETIVRYPINLYVTSKALWLTALLKPRLKLLAFVGLVLVQVIYPVIFFSGAVVCSIVGWAGACVVKTYGMLQGDTSPKEFLTTYLEWIPKVTREYWNAHVEFVSRVRVAGFLDPTGLPMDWDGRRYDIPENLGPVQLFMGIVLTIYGVLTTTVGVSVILIIRYPILHVRYIFFYLEHMFTALISSCIALAYLPFWLVGLGLVIVLVPVLFALGIILSPTLGLYSPYIAVVHDFNLRLGFLAAITVLQEVDKGTSMPFLLDGEENHPCNFRLLPDLVQQSVYDRPDLNESLAAETTQQGSQSQKLWDLWEARCRAACLEAVAAGWLAEADVAAADPAVLTAVPALALLRLLEDSLAADPEGRRLQWDGATACTRATAARRDAAELLWPRAAAALSGLRAAGAPEERAWAALRLAAAGATAPPALAAALAAAEDEPKAGQGQGAAAAYVAPARRRALMRGVCAEINGAVTVLLRMQEMQKRLGGILQQGAGKDAPR